jgi:hypothetical protein
MRLSVWGAGTFSFSSSMSAAYPVNISIPIVANPLDSDSGVGFLVLRDVRSDKTVPPRLDQF